MLVCEQTALGVVLGRGGAHDDADDDDCDGDGEQAEGDCQLEPPLTRHDGHRWVLELQRLLPLARVVYCSATGASDLSNMAYMERLALWGPSSAFKSFDDFVAAVTRRGVGGLEMLAMEMKSTGMYAS